MNKLDAGDKAGLLFMSLIFTFILTGITVFAVYDIIIKANGWEEQCEVTE